VDFDNTTNRGVQFFLERKKKKKYQKKVVKKIRMIEMYSIILTQLKYKIGYDLIFSNGKGSLGMEKGESIRKKTALNKKEQKWGKKTTQKK